MLNYMRILKWRLPFMCIALLCLLFTSHTSADWLDDYAGYVKKEATKYNVPGYAFVFYEQGKAPRVYVYGKTRKRNGSSITKDTVFR